MGGRSGGGAGGGSVTWLWFPGRKGQVEKRLKWTSVDDFTGWGTGAGGGRRSVWDPRWRWLRVGSDRGFAFEKLVLGTGPPESASPVPKCQEHLANTVMPSLSDTAHPCSAREVNGPK